jgi:GTP-binding protein
VLIHLVDGTAEKLGAAYRTIRTELTAYSPALAAKPELVGLNKIDALTPEEVERKARALARAVKAGGSGGRVFRVSGVSGKGVDPLIEAAFAAIEAYRAASAAASPKAEPVAS